MQQPQPIDVNRLKGILGNARNIINKGDNFERGHVDQSMMVDGNQLVENAQGGTPMANTQSVAPRMSGNQPVYNNIASSKMPDNIKKAMMEQPIPQFGSPNHTFNLEDVMDEKPMPMVNPTPRKQPSAPAPMRESYVSQPSSDTFTVSEAALRGIVKDILLEFMTETFTKTLSEDVIKKTIGTLIKEGKIGAKKKTTAK
jgi:hypothetical protein